MLSDKPDGSFSCIFPVTGTKSEKWHGSFLSPAKVKSGLVTAIQSILIIVVEKIIQGFHDHAASHNSFQKVILCYLLVGKNS